jgi:hypothetical protein
VYKYPDYKYLIHGQHVRQGGPLPPYPREEDLCTALTKEQTVAIKISKRLWKNLANRWRKMVARCENPKHRDYKNYGGRGIHIWPEWRDPVAGLTAYIEYIVTALLVPTGVSLECALDGRGPSLLSIDRIDNNDGYRPGNLRLATPRVQSANQRRTVYVELDGVKLPRTSLARLFGVDPRTAARRQRLGYSAADAASLATGGLTAQVRRQRDQVILAMIETGHLFVDAHGFVLVRSADGWYLPPVGQSGDGRYLGVSITVPREFSCLVSTEQRSEADTYRSSFQHARVVALFHQELPTNDNYYEVDHINMNTRDDRPGNLRWRLPENHRSDDHRDREQPVVRALDYRDVALQQAALQACIAAALNGRESPSLVNEPEVPTNLDAATVDELIALVKADPDYPASLWASPEYAHLLPLVLAAAGNNAGRFGDGVIIERMPQVGDTLQALLVTALRISDRVYFGCTKCGRQSFAVRTEIRNRLRYAKTPCASCNALDRIAPALAAATAADPATGIKRHPSRITAGSSDHFHFHCRVEGCPNLLRRRIKTQVRQGELPTCEFHRKRGMNFG